MSLIRLQNVSMSFDSNVILRDVFFRLSRGDRVGLIGKNGSGKTTLLKLILGQEEPTAGTVAVDQELAIGYFSQFSELSGEATLLDVLHEVSAPIHAIEEALKRSRSRSRRSPAGRRWIACCTARPPCSRRWSGSTAGTAPCGWTPC